jgi:protein-disulfide isomerase
MVFEKLGTTGKIGARPSGDLGYGVPMRNRSLSRLSRHVVLLTTLVAAAGCKKSPSTPPTPAPAPAQQAAKQTSIGGAMPAAIDPGKLDAFKRKVFDEVVGREPSACGKGHSLLHSVKNDPECRASYYAVRYVARLADAGLSDSDIVDKLEQRFRTPRVTYIDTSAAPSKGSATPRVTIVEFADYECEHCKLAQPVMRTLLAEYPKDVTLFYKHFPLGGHVNSLNAALGAVGAHKQGKFWEFSDKVWENSEHLSPAVLEGIAKEIHGLDFQRWYADLSTEEVRSQVLRDRTEGRSLEIRRTPAIFINGRRFGDDIDLANLKDWVDEELGR